MFGFVARKHYSLTTRKPSMLKDIPTAYALRGQREIHELSTCIPKIPWPTTGYSTPRIKERKHDFS